MSPTPLSPSRSAHQRCAADANHMAWHQLPQIALAQLGFSQSSPPDVGPFSCRGWSACVEAVMTHEHILGNVESLATAVGIAIAAIWTYWLFVRKRERYPRAHTQHEIAYQLLPNGKMLLHVKLLIENIGSVLISLDRLLLTVDRIAPLRPDLLDKKLAEHRPKDPSGRPQISFYCIGRRTIHFNRFAFEIEPTELDAEHFDFVIPGDTRVIKVCSYVRNASRRVHGRWYGIQVVSIGWRETSFHEIDPTVSAFSPRMPTERRRQWNASGGPKGSRGTGTLKTLSTHPGKEEKREGSAVVRAEAAVEGEAVEGAASADRARETWDAEAAKEEGEGEGEGARNEDR